MIVITTPAGQIGSQVLENLAGSGEHLRLVARDLSGVPADIRQRVEVSRARMATRRGGRHSTARTPSSGCAPRPRAESVEAAYVGSPARQPRRSGGTGSSASSASRRSAAAPRGRSTRETSPASLAMDDLIASTGVAYRALTKPSFMDNIARQAESIKNQGMFFSPIDGDRKLPAVATRDIAAAATRLLLDDSWSGVGEVPLLGPEDLSFNDMAEIISEVLGSRCASSRSPSRPTRTDSPASACPMRWLRG